MQRSSPRGRVRGRLLALVLLVAPSACLVHEHRVGLGPVGVGAATARQYYFLFGLQRINDVDAQRLALGKTSFLIRSRMSFWDVVLAPLLAPLTMTSRTVTVEW
ncbi:MAG: hypothetical protein R3F56_22110 [Planctomycetota bacterium]